MWTGIIVLALVFIAFVILIISKVKEGKNRSSRGDAYPVYPTGEFSSGHSTDANGGDAGGGM